MCRCHADCAQPRHRPRRTAHPERQRQPGSRSLVVVHLGRESPIASRAWWKSSGEAAAGGRPVQRVERTQATLSVSEDFGASAPGPGSGKAFLASIGVGLVVLGKVT